MEKKIRDSNWQRDWKMPEFDSNGMTKWGWKVQHPENLSIGKHSDIGSFSYINAKFGVSIGERVQVGSHCAIYSVSTIDGKTGGVKIKRNARIGSHSLVAPGVTIGENSVIGAFSFVNSDIPDNVIAFGTPARVHRKLTAEDKKRFGIE